MRRLVVLLLILGVLTLGCAQQVQKHVGYKHGAPTTTPTKITIPKPTTPIQDINKTLSEVNELLNQLQSVDNVSFNL